MDFNLVSFQYITTLINFNTIFNIGNKRESKLIIFEHYYTWIDEKAFENIITLFKKKEI